jgi:outer membrane protein TolC
VARSGYFPSLRLGATYDWDNPALVDPALPPTVARSGWQVGLSLTYPLFDGFRREENMTRAAVDERVATAEVSDTRRAVRALAEQLLGEIRLAEERIVLAGKSVDVAKEDLRVQQERYRMGVTTMLDLLASQSSLVEAEQSLVGARFDYRLARAELQALAGRQP